MSIKSCYPDIEVAEIPFHRLMLMRLQQHADRTAVTDAATGVSFTFTQLADSIQRVASGLVKLGVKKGDVVAMYSYNTAEWIIMFWSLMSAGATVTPVNPAYTKYELAHHLNDSGACYIYTISDLLPTTKQALKTSPNVKRVISLRSDDSTCVHYEDLLRDDGSQWCVCEGIQYNMREDVALIPYSSGTTGPPKGVLLTHYNIMAHWMQYANPAFIDPDGLVKIQRGEAVFVVVVPLYHVYGLIAMNVFALGGGIHLVILPRFEPHSFLQAIEKYKITRLPLVPPLVQFLAKSPLVSEYDLSSVERVVSGAAPLSAGLEVELKTRLDVPDMRQGYGMTEATAGACVYGYDVPLRPGSCGKLLPSTEAQIVDPTTKKVLGANERGELWLRGPQVMKGYLNRPEETRKTLDEERWLHTGDVAYYDDDHYFFIVDRLKELIKVKGFQVAPAELEALLLKHPAVIDAGVVGVPDERAGELPRAFVVKKGETTEKELYDYTAERTAPFKHLNGGIQFVSEIPRLPSGKIVRRQLKVMASKSHL